MSEEKRNINVFKRTAKVLLWIIGGILLLFTAIYLLLQVPTVQSFVGKKITNYIAERTDTEASLHSVSISITKGLKLEGLKIADYVGTFANIGSLNISLLNSLYSLRYRKLNVKNITLDDTSVLWLVNTGETESNIQKFINKLSGPPGADKTKEKFVFDLKDITLNNFKADIKDFNSNNVQELSIKKLNLQFDIFEPTNNKFAINDFSIEEPKLFTTRVGNKVALVNANPRQDQATNKISKKLYLKINTLSVLKGLVEHYNIQVPDRRLAHFNKDNYAVKKINIKASNLLFDEVISGSISELDLVVDDRWSLNKLNIEEFIYDKESIKLSNYELKTARSLLQDNLNLTLTGSAKKFFEDASIDGNFNNSYINLEDLAYFVPSVMNNPIVANLGKDPIYLDGKIEGLINDLSLKNIKLSVRNKLDYKGDIAIENITNSNAKIIFDIADFKTTVSSLDQEIKAFKPSKGILSLNKISYSGKVGYDNKNISINGFLKTDLGDAKIDMTLAHKGQQKYKGKISADDFDLGKLIGVKELGRTSFVIRELDANGTDFNTSTIIVNGDINKIEYGKNTFRNIVMDGILNKGTFEGRLKSNDPVVNFDFDGFVNKEGENYETNFYSNVNNVDLYKLGITKVPLVFKGSIQLDGIGKDLNSFVGNMLGENIVIAKSDSTYVFSKIELNSKILENNSKTIELNTDGVNIELEGDIDYAHVIEDTKLLIASNFPYYTKDWRLQKDYSNKAQNFRFDVLVSSISPFDEIFGLNDIQLSSLRAKGNVNTKKNEINIVGSFPELSYKKQKFYNGSTFINLLNQSGEVNFHSDSSEVEGIKFYNYDIDSKIQGDKIGITFSSKNLRDSISRVEIKSELSPHPKGYVLKILNSDLRLYNRRWKFGSENSIAFGKEYIEIKNFNISDGNRTLEISDINNKGVQIKANKFALSAVNTFLKDKNFNFGGELTSALRMNDIFEQSPDIYGTLLVNNFTINNDPYGEINLDISKPVNESIKAILSIDHQATKQTLKSTIDYNTNTKIISANVKGRKVPLKWLEYILKNNVKDMKGDLDLDGTVSGPIKNLKINADGIANNGSVKVVYLGEIYTFNNEKFKITENNIDLTGAKLFDSERNSAEITGGLRHKLFKDVAFNVRVESSKIIALNTTKSDNPIYYGIGKGSVILDISGLTNKANMIINARTAAGTVLNIPISANAISETKGFITFVDRNEYNVDGQTAVAKKTVKLDGLQIEMNIDMTPEAQVNLIFDERVGDVIKGNGAGNIRIFSPRLDLLEMYGSFEIQRGEYLFTAKDFMAKPFKVKPGGMIRWTGDPINASINLEAEYSVRTSVYTYLNEEFLSTQDLKDRAKPSTAVNVTLILGNTLFNPSIGFNLDFPELLGDIKNYATTKTRLLKGNEADFNGQVFALLMFNSFLPSNALSDIVSINSVASAGLNSFSEFVSSQFSMFVTNILNKALTDNGLISGLDFNLNMRNNAGFGNQNPNNSSPNPDNNSPNADNNSLFPTEIEVRLGPKFKFLSDKVDINFGGNYIRGSQFNQGINQDYVVPDFVVNIALTEDRKLNFRLYGRYDFDEIAFSGRRQLFGFGLRYRSEFGDMLETKTDLTEFLKNRVKAEN